MTFRSFVIPRNIPKEYLLFLVSLIVGIIFTYFAWYYPDDVHVVARHDLYYSAKKWYTLPSLDEFSKRNQDPNVSKYFYDFLTDNNVYYDQIGYNQYYNKKLSLPRDYETFRNLYFPSWLDKGKTYYHQFTGGALTAILSTLSFYLILIFLRSIIYSVNHLRNVNSKDSDNVDISKTRRFTKFHVTPLVYYSLFFCIPLIALWFYQYSGIFSSPDPNVLYTGVDSTVVPLFTNTGYNHSENSSESSVDDVFSQEPKVIFEAAPKYPEKALREKIEGTVKLKLLVATNGKVKDVQIISSENALLTRAAIDAAWKYKFNPAISLGVPKEFSAVVPFHFKLEK